MNRMASALSDTARPTPTPRPQASCPQAPCPQAPCSQGMFLGKKRMFLGKRVRSLGLQIAMSLGFLPVALSAGSALSAEQITLTYGALERSISVESLAAYAENGEIPKELQSYTRHLTDQQLADLHGLLTSRADLTPVAVSQFLYTDQGEILLRRLGQVIRTEGNLSGFYAIRSALILAAAEPEGLTVLNVLENYPLSRVRVDLSRTMQIWSDLEDLISQTQSAVALVEEQATVESNVSQWIDFNTLPDIRRPGVLGWELHSLTLTDHERNRTFPLDVYLPQTQDQTPILNAPVIVISHGLGSDRSTYAYLAKHLASYGFAVAVPEHPGSNAEQLQALISGSASQVTAPSEFVDRPLDIKFLLDELDYLSRSGLAFQRRIDLNHVGVIGQSMGGYTALALAGAQINFNRLETDCTDDTFNLSLLLQCRALELPASTPTFRDERVKAVIAINPIGSSLLGQDDYASIQIPVMMVSGSSDTIAPALLEQIRPFTWLQAPERYLVMMQGGTHFSTIDVPNPSAAETGEIVPLPSQIVGPEPELAQTYLKGMSLAFLGSYVARDQNYQTYLEPAYAKAVSQDPMPMNLVRSLTPNQLATVLEEPIDEPDSVSSRADNQTES